MKPIVDLFWNLCLLRVGPERMPTASLFVVLVLVTNLIVSALVALSAPGGNDLATAVSAPVISAAVLASGTWLMLQAKGVPQRFTATLTALLGADIVITALSWPLILMMQAGAEPGGMQIFLALGQFALIFWWVTISGFVFSRALEVSRTQGVAVAIFIVLATLIVTFSIFPPTPVDPGPPSIDTL